MRVTGGAPRPGAAGDIKLEAPAIVAARTEVEARRVHTKVDALGLQRRVGKKRAAARHQVGRAAKGKESHAPSR